MQLPKWLLKSTASPETNHQLVKNMKKLSALIAALCLAGFVVKAEEGKKHKMTDEQKTLKKEMVAKYDTDKDGKLSKEESAKMSDEDKKKMEDAGLSHHKKGKKQ